MMRIGLSATPGPDAMTFVMQQMRRVCKAYTDGTSGFIPHLEAVEQTAENAPFMSAERAKALIEICCKTIAEERSLPREKADLNDLVSDLTRTIPFAGLNHPDEKSIEEALRKLVRSVNASVGALAQLNNIEGLRHGGSANWESLGFHHGAMLLSLADALCAFLYEAHRRSFVRDGKRAYEDEAEFNLYLDELHPVEVDGVLFRASEVLWSLNLARYDEALARWRIEAEADEGPVAEVARAEITEAEVVNDEADGV
jgi:hypothetical protein